MLFRTEWISGDTVKISFSHWPKLHPGIQGFYVGATANFRLDATANVPASSNCSGSWRPNQLLNEQKEFTLLSFLFLFFNNGGAIFHLLMMQHVSDFKVRQLLVIWDLACSCYLASPFLARSWWDYIQHDVCHCLLHKNLRFAWNVNLTKCRFYPYIKTHVHMLILM